MRPSRRPSLTLAGAPSLIRKYSCRVEAKYLFVPRTTLPARYELRRVLLRDYLGGDIVRQQRLHDGPGRVRLAHLEGPRPHLRQTRRIHQQLVDLVRERGQLVAPD